jgi:hypothetical protein
MGPRHPPGNKRQQLKKAQRDAAEAKQQANLALRPTGKDGADFYNLLFDLLASDPKRYAFSQALIKALHEHYSNRDSTDELDLNAFLAEVAK